MTTTQHITVALVIAILLVPQILALYLTSPRRPVRKSEQFNYCSGPMKYKVPVIPAKAGIQCRSAIADWTPAFAGVTNSNINGPDQ